MLQLLLTSKATLQEVFHLSLPWSIPGNLLQEADRTWGANPRGKKMFPNNGKHDIARQGIVFPRFCPPVHTHHSGRKKMRQRTLQWIKRSLFTVTARQLMVPTLPLQPYSLLAWHLCLVFSIESSLFVESVARLHDRIYVLISAFVSSLAIFGRHPEDLLKECRLK